MKAVCVTAAGEVLSEDSVATFATEGGWPDRVRERVAEIEQTMRAPAASIGLAAPGIASPDGRAIWWMQGRLNEVQGLDWAKVLGRRDAVPVLNDAQAALLGETWRGAAAGCANVLMLTLGTGVGGAAMVDGQLLRGHIGRAGHVGHISLNPAGQPDIVNTPGSLEDAIGECTLRTRSGGRFESTLLMLSTMISRDDPEAKQIWNASVRALAAGIASLVNVLDPEVVILGGGVTAAREHLFGPLEQLLDRFEWRPHGHRVRLVPARLEQWAGALGAAKYAMDQKAA